MHIPTEMMESFITETWPCKNYMLIALLGNNKVDEVTKKLHSNEFNFDDLAFIQKWAEFTKQHGILKDVSEALEHQKFSDSTEYKQVAEIAAPELKSAAEAPLTLKQTAEEESPPQEKTIPQSSVKQKIDFYNQKDREAMNQQTISTARIHSVLQISRFPSSAPVQNKEQQIVADLKPKEKNVTHSKVKETAAKSPPSYLEENRNPKQKLK